MAKVATLKLTGLFNIDGVQNGQEDFSYSVQSEYKQRRRMNGHVQLSDGQILVSLTGIAVSVVVIQNTGGGTLSVLLSGANSESLNVPAGSFFALATGGVSDLTFATSSATPVTYDLLLLGN